MVAKRSVIVACKKIEEAHKRLRANVYIIHKYNQIHIVCMLHLIYVQGAMYSRLRTYDHAIIREARGA